MKQEIEIQADTNDEIHRQSFRGQEFFPEIPGTFTMRCPKCRKLYSVETLQVSLAKAPLKFQCIACDIKFTADVESAEQGALLSTYEIKQKVPEPPLMPIGSSDNPGVRVAFERVPLTSPAFAISSGRLNAHPDLENEWETVLADYENQAAHSRFISACEKAGVLQFAAKKYMRILTASPHEEIAKSMRSRVIALVSYSSETRGRAQPPWGFRVPALNNFIFVIGGVLLAMGLLLPRVRNLADLGFAAILLALGVKFFLRPPTLR